MASLSSILNSVKGKNSLSGLFSSANQKTSSILNSVKPGAPSVTAKPVTPTTTRTSSVIPVTVAAPEPLAPKPVITYTPAKPQVKTPAPAPVSTPVAPISSSTPNIPVAPVAPANTNNNSSSSTSYSDRSEKKAKPTVPSVNQEAVTSAEKAYKALMTPSSDELATQKDLDSLIESTKKGYLNTENKVIPMQFITGQLSAMEKRASALAEPLESKLARLQASRTSSLEASKFALERADKALQTETDLSKPQTVGGNIVKLNPTTGQYDTMYKGSTSQPASVQEYEYAKAAGYNGSFNDYQNEDANRKAIALGAGGLTTSQQNAAFKLSDDYRAESKDFFAQKSAYNRILSSAQDPSAAGDLALIFNYMKVLDPGSTVREGEFATAQNSGSIGERITAQYNKVMSGERLAPEQRADFVDRATKLFTGAQQGQKQIDDTYRNRAAQYGVPVDLILSDTSANNAPKTLDQYYKQNPADQPKVDQLIMENPDLSDDDILQILTGKSFNSAGNASASNRPQRNNNPLNIKASNTTRAYEGVSGTDPSPASDGGQFLTFNSPEAGFNAAKTLISSTIYSGLDIDSALRKWSGGGYGSEIVPELKGRQMATLTQAELDKLINKMAQREGYYA